MTEYKFNVKEVKNHCVNWIRAWFEENGDGCNAVIGISGGADSTVVAALCVEALGKDRVIGVMMPNGDQPDIDDSFDVIEHLGIYSIYVDVYDAIYGISGELNGCYIEPPKCGSGHLYEFSLSQQAKINLPPRIRMATLYAVSQSVNGRVANTCNLSEDYVGYFTRWGDGVGDFAPIAQLTKTEVVEIGMELGLPEHLVRKTPSDGLCGKTDEDNLGFTYAMLDEYIRWHRCEDAEVRRKIDFLHERNRFKLDPIPTFYPLPSCIYDLCVSGITV